MSHRRILLGALLSAATIAALPSAASAATCTYDHDAGTLDIRYEPGEESVTIQSSSLNLYFTSFGVGQHACHDSSGPYWQTAGMNSVDKLTVRPAPGTAAQTQTTILDETTGVGLHGSSNPDFEIAILTGTDDRLVLKTGNADDEVQIKQGTGLGGGPVVDLNNDGELDVKMQTMNSVVEVRAGAGSDFVSAALASTFTVDLFGEGGTDMLIGGKRAGDRLDGGADNDFLYSYTDDLYDQVRGGSGHDTGKFDFGIDDFSGVENAVAG